MCWILLGCLLSFANQYAGLWLALPAFGTVWGHVVSIAYLAALLFVLLSAARSAARLSVSNGFLIIAGLCFAFPELLSIISGIGAVATATKQFAPIEALISIIDALPLAVQFFTSNLLGPLGMILLGAGIGRLIRHPNTFLASAGFAMFFDVVVVTMGPVAQLIKNGSNVISSVSMGAGGPSNVTTHPGFFGGHLLSHLPQSLSTVTVGPADILFISLFITAVHALHLSERVTFGWMYALLLAALVVAETTGLPIPALAPMGLSVLIANLRHAAFTRTEKRDLAIGAAFAVVCAIVLVGAARRVLPSPPPLFGFRFLKVKSTGLWLVEDVAPGSPAQKGGLQSHDVIVSVDGISTPKLTDEQFSRERAQSASTGLKLHISRPSDGHMHDLVLKPEAP